MIVNDLNIERYAILPAKADSPLTVDPNTPLPLPIALQGLKSIPGRHSERAEVRHSVNHLELAPRGVLDFPRKTTNLQALEDRSSPLVCEAFNHGESIARR